jgi:hypothetical protein
MYQFKKKFYKVNKMECFVDNKSMCKMLLSILRQIMQGKIRDASNVVYGRISG